MSTLKTNNIQHVDLADPSILLNSDGSVSIAGTVSYEDATNVDAVGIITGRSLINAQKQVHVGTGVSIAAGGLNVTAGISTLAGIHLDDTLSHTGDTDTKIRFPAADTISIETGGITRATVTGNTIDFPDAGTLRFGASQDLQIYHGTGGASNIIHSNTSQPLIIHASGAGSIRFDTNSNERLSINSAGLVSIPVAGNLQVGGAGSAETDSKLYVANTGGNAYIQIKGADSSGTVGLKFGRNSVANRAGIDWSASTDTLVFRTGGTENRLNIESNGQINIGGAAVSQNRNLNLASNSEANFAIETHNDAASESANIRFYKSRGTGASPTAVADNHYIGQLIFYGQDGTDYANTVAYTRVQVDGTVASNQIPGEMEFGINDGSSATRAMTIHKTGNVLFSGLTAKNDPRNAKGIALKSASGISFQTYGANGSRNWRIRQDDMTGWGTLEFSVSPTANDSSDWPDAAGDVVMSLESGNVKLTNSDLVMGNGKGISFAATANSAGSTSSELLDDYEEGTFTPTLYYVSGTSGIQYNIQQGRYTKVGRLVSFQLRLQLSNKGSGTNNVRIGGLPFTPSTSGLDYDYFIITAVVGMNLGSAGKVPFAQMEDYSVGRITLYSFDYSSGTNYGTIGNSEIADSFYVGISGNYVTAT